MNLNPVWRFYLGSPGKAPFAPSFDDSRWKTVALPHTFKETSLDLDRCKDNNRQLTFHRDIGWYRKELDLPRVDTATKQYFLHFEGAMQTTEVWVNGSRVGKYAVSGYDSFHFDITDLMRAGKNLIAVKVDNTVNEFTPPDGAKMKKDFVLFGGLYRDVNLVITGKTHVTFPWEARDAGIRVTCADVDERSATVHATTAVKNEGAAAVSCSLKTTILAANGSVVGQVRSRNSVRAGQTHVFKQVLPALRKPHLWGPDHPYLYRARTEVFVNGRTADTMETRFGIRFFEFTKDKGFFLNGKPLKLIGSNRHQTWPYVGNAVPNSMHRLDAQIMKDAGLNWVRLSHYPHDPAFLDACDELGLMALEEGPTWMGTNSQEWVNNLEISFRSLLRRDRNHPSILTWNACVNHGGARDYLVRACEEEDYRPAASRFPRTPMNFRHGSVSGGGALTIEHTGHTYPRRRGTFANGISSDWQLAKRHWEHINASYLKEDNAGMASWCMFDYNSFHNNNEMNIVWHGMCDLLRLPKYSYFWHQSELLTKPVVYVVRYCDTGVSVFSNGDQVELFEDTGLGFRSRGKQRPDAGFALHHPPFSFAVSADAKAIKAVAFKNGVSIGEHVWRKPGKPVALKLELDRPSLVADGSDFARVIIAAVDRRGTEIPFGVGPAAIWVDGPARIIGGNPVQFRQGKAVVLLQSHYYPGTITIGAECKGLRAVSRRVTIKPIAGHVYMPASLPPPLRGVRKPTILQSNSLADMPAIRATTGWRSVQINASATGEPIIIAGKTYENGIGVHAPSELIYRIPAAVDTFTAAIGTTHIHHNTSLTFEVYLDALKVFDSGLITKDSPVQAIDLNVLRHETIRLVVTDGGNGNGSDHAAWVDAKFSYTGRKPKPIRVSKRKGPAPFAFPTIINVTPKTWVVSEIVMINGKQRTYPISIKGGEYQVYSNPWTGKSGAIIPGDAVKVRVKSAGKSGATTCATLLVGEFAARFTVMTE